MQMARGFKVSDLIPLDTHAQRIAAIQAIPRTTELAMEGNPFYWGLLWETQVGLTFHALTPWRWNT